MVDKIIDGARRFKEGAYQEQQELFNKLATGQSPDVLFITCSDSRVDPSLITQSDPGDLFIIRNAGNIVPPHALATGGTTASTEYAVGVLGVKHIVVCGHTDCGAMKGALNRDALTKLPHVCEWLGHCEAAVLNVQENFNSDDEDKVLENLIERNVLLQLQHLRTHPYVAARLQSGKVKLHGWVYDIGKGTFKAYNEKTDTFEELLMEAEQASLHADRAPKEA
tara:strand:+ start:352939 stop:353607 length:669 start_codon:yes stop_codon:yes gene_type:complete